MARGGVEGKVATLLFSCFSGVGAARGSVSAASGDGEVTESVVPLALVRTYPSNISNSSVLSTSSLEVVVGDGSFAGDDLSCGSIVSSGLVAKVVTPPLGCGGCTGL